MTEFMSPRSICPDGLPDVTDSLCHNTTGKRYFSCHIPWARRSLTVLPTVGTIYLPYCL